MTDMAPSTISTPKTVPEVIRAARDAQGLSLRDFAEPLGVSHNTVSQWERGVAEPDTARVASWFNDPREWLRELSTEIFVARYRATLLERPYSTAAAGNDGLAWSA